MNNFNANNNSKASFDNEKEKVKRMYEDGKDKASEMYEDGKREAKSMMNDMSDKASEMYNQACETAGVYYDKGKAAMNAAQDSLEEYSDKLVDMITKKPLTAVVVAAALGFLVSTMFKKKD